MAVRSLTAVRSLRAARSLYIMLDDGYWAARALASLAEILLSQGDYQQAAELSNQAADGIPGDTEALTTLAYAQWQAGSPADAEMTFSLVLHWDADTADALAGRGQVRADLGSYSLALDDLDVDDERIAGLEIRNFLAGGELCDLLGFDLFEDIHGKFSIRCAPWRALFWAGSTRVRRASTLPRGVCHPAVTPFRSRFLTRILTPWGNAAKRRPRGRAAAPG